MRRIFEFDDFMSNLSLSLPQQEMIKNFVRKYEKYFKFHDPEEFNNSLDEIVNDVMSQLSLDPSLKDAVKDYISGLQDLSDGISVIMAPNPQIIYRTQPDMVQTIMG
jgi:phosphomevalonate kinase